MDKTIVNKPMPVPDYDIMVRDLLIALRAIAPATWSLHLAAGGNTDEETMQRTLIGYELKVTNDEWVDENLAATTSATLCEKLVGLVATDILRHRFLLACKDFGVFTEGVDMWLTIREAYTRPIRKYHTLAHIEAMLLWLAYYNTKSDVRDIHAVEMAIFFHDVICEPEADDNESRSAHMAGEFLSQGGDTSRVAAVKLLIMDTKRQWEPKDKDARLMCDLDYSVFGGSVADYAFYSAAIREEYAHCDPAEYTAGRVAFLQTVINRDRIFLTGTIADKAEKSARANISTELARLQEGSALVACNTCGNDRDPWASGGQATWADGMLSVLQHCATCQTLTWSVPFKPKVI